MKTTVWVTAQNGTSFRLTSLEMIECDAVPYVALRQEIKNAFKDTKHVRYFVRGRMHDTSTVLAYVRRTRTQISIGCQTFSGVEFKKLKKWATPKVKHARTRR